MLHYISRSVRVVVNCIVRVSQSKIPLNIYGGGERWCNVTTVRVVPFASCLMFYGHHRKESDFRSNNGILLKLISMLHAIMLSVRVMSICFHKFQTFKQFQI
jgi:hypothetical protein